MRKSLIELGAILLISELLSCKNVEFKPSYLSDSIKESKSKDVFICGYNLTNKDLLNNFEFNYNEIWVEKKWSNYLDKNKREKFKINDSTFQLVINFKNDSFIKNRYWNELIIKDDIGNVMGSDKNLLFLNIDKSNYKPVSLKLYLFRVKEKFQPNLDTIRIGELLLDPL